MKYLSLILVTFFMASCATVSVNTDYDSSADFSKLKTYQWASEGPSKTGDSRIDGNTLLQNRIKNAVDADLTLKGFKKATMGTPDFLLNYHVSAKDKTDVQSFGPTYYGGSYYGNHYGYAGGRHDFAGSYPMHGSSGVTTYHYTEGTLLIDIIDPSTKHLIWRGTGTKIVNPDASSEQKRQTVNDAVQKILTTFPPVQ